MPRGFEKIKDHSQLDCKSYQVVGPKKFVQSLFIMLEYIGISFRQKSFHIFWTLYVMRT